MLSPQQSTSIKCEVEEIPGPGSDSVTKENLKSCSVTKSNIVLLRCDKERDLPLFKFEYDNSIIAIPDYPNNLAYVEWFDFSLDWATPIRITFHFVAAHPETGEVNHGFGQYQKVLCVSFEHHFSNVKSIFQIASQFQSCHKLKIHLDENNIVKNENEATLLQQMHNLDIEHGPEVSNKKAYLCLAVKTLELTVTKWHDDNQKMISLEYDQLRFDLILEFAQRSCPNLEYIRISWDGNKNTSKCCSKLIFAFLEKVHVTFEDKVRVNFGPAVLKKRKTVSECQEEIQTQSRKRKNGVDAVIVDTVAADKQQEQRMSSLSLPSQTTPSCSSTGNSNSATRVEQTLASNTNLEKSPLQDHTNKDQAPKNVPTPTTSRSRITRSRNKPQASLSQAFHVPEPPRRRRGRPGTRPPTPPGPKPKRGRGRPKRSGAAPKDLVCKDCGKRFNHRARGNLNKHREWAHGDGPGYTCPECNRVFTTKQPLRRHQLTHRARQNRILFRCPSCGEDFTRKSNLRTHQKGKTSRCKVEEGITIRPVQDNAATSTEEEDTSSDED